MADLIDRQAVKEWLQRWDGYVDQDIIARMQYRVIDIPSAQPNEKECRRQGEWDMFELITTAWYGKQCYFLESTGIVYSRKSSKYMEVHDAILEFLREIGDG